MKEEVVIVLDFGGQYNQLVARRVRECNVYCEIYSYRTDIEKIKAMNPKGIILTGGPNSCYEADSPTYKKELFELGIPVLGLCYACKKCGKMPGNGTAGNSGKPGENPADLCLRGNGAPGKIRACGERNPGGGNDHGGTSLYHNG